MPPQLIPKGCGTSGLVLASKTVDGLSFYRQERIFERLGLDQPQTLNGQVFSLPFAGQAQRCARKTLVSGRPAGVQPVMAREGQEISQNNLLIRPPKTANINSGSGRL